MKPFRLIYLFEYVDLFLVDETTQNALYIPDRNKIIFNKKELGIEETILNARSIYIHPDNFANWSLFLVNKIANQKFSTLKQRLYSFEPGTSARCRLSTNKEQKQVGPLQNCGCGDAWAPSTIQSPK
jgi:hypothetical protein